MTYIGLIRGINVGGNKIVKMADLRLMLEAMGYQSVRTVLQSGNFVFDAENAVHAEGIGNELLVNLGVAAAVFVFPAARWQQFIQNNPMPVEAADNPSRFLLYLSDREFEDKDLPDAMARAAQTEKAAVVDGALYVSAPEGIGTSKMLASREWAKYVANATARNWSTIQNLGALAGT